jgi:lipid-A-disaccharide synthase
MKLYIIAGEASGDLHGSNLIKALKRQAPGVHCRVWGGELMQAAGGELVKHYRDLAFMGFLEVVKNLRTIFRNLDFCKKDILAFQPDAIVLIDYPGFNLRIAKWAKQQGIKVIYYISPQIWAWHKSRVYDIKRDVDKMLVILPFEPEFYGRYGVEATYVGHPLLDAITSDGKTSDVERQTSNVREWITTAEVKPPGNETKISEVERTSDVRRSASNVIALLPGSRRQEVSKILPRMLSVIQFFPDYKFVIAGATSLPVEYYQSFLGRYPQVELIQGKTYEILRGATAALVKSGTSTLEAALIGVPEVVCYAGNPISFMIAKRLVDVKYISLVNLIVDKPLVRELIQDELNTANIKAGLEEILDPAYAAGLKEQYAELRHLLGDGGASEKAAKEILEV